MSWKFGVRAYPLLFVVLLLSLAAYLGFQQQHNDFWDNYFIASHMSWGDTQTWFNPQYPIGYGLFLKGIMGDGLPVVPAILANILFMAILLFVCGWLYLKLLIPVWAFFALVGLSLFPEMFHYAIVGGGDPGAVAFFTLGAALLLAQLSGLKVGRPRLFFIAGVFMGVAGLFRYHALVANAMFFLAFFVIYPRQWKMLFIAGLGVLAGYSPQWVVNLAAGRGLLETQFGPMNVYFLMHQINWYRVTDLVMPHSSMEIIAADPSLFFRKYLQAFLSFYPAYLPPFFAALFERDPIRQKIARALALWVFLYFLLFSATVSGRQILLVLPFSFLALGMSLRILAEKLGRFPRLRVAAPAVAMFLVLLLQGRIVVYAVEWRASVRDARISVESLLKREGVTRASEVFTSDYNLYFRTLPDYMPYFNGGAPRWGTYLYNETFPEFPVDSGEDFVATCRLRGVRFVILDGGSPELSIPMGKLYEGLLEIPGLALERAQDGYKIYRVL